MHTYIHTCIYLYSRTSGRAPPCPRPDTYMSQYNTSVCICVCIPRCIHLISASQLLTSQVLTANLKIIDVRYHDFNGFPVVNWYYKPLKADNGRQLL